MNQSSGCDEAGRDDRLIDSWVTKESVPLFIVCYIDSPLWHFHYCRVDLYCLILKSLYFVYLSCLCLERKSNSIESRNSMASAGLRDLDDIWRQKHHSVRGIRWICTISRGEAGHQSPSIHVAPALINLLSLSLLILCFADISHGGCDHSL